MNLLAQILEENNRSFIGFGIHENVMIMKIDGEPRRNKDGAVTNALFYTKWGIVDAATGSVVQEREMTTFPLKYDSEPDKVAKAVTLNYGQLACILTCFYDVDTAWSIFNPFAAVGITDTAQIKQVLTKKSNMDLFNKTMKEQYIAATAQFVNSTRFLFRVKFVYPKGSTYLELPLSNFIEPMSIPKEQSKLVITPQEEIYRAEATAPKKPDNLAPGVPGMPGAPAVPGMAGVPGVPVPGATAPGVSAPGVSAPGVPGTAAAPAPQYAAAPVNPLSAAADAATTAVANAAPVNAAAPQPAATPQPANALPHAPFEAPTGVAATAPVANPMGGIPTLG